MSVNALLNRFRREVSTEGTRINRLLEADIGTLDERLEPFLFRPRPAEPDRNRERRTEPRFASRTPCDVSVMTPGSACSAQGVICDLSRSGLGLTMSCPLASGLEVMVRFGRLVIFGAVRYSRRGENGEYHVGVGLRDVFEVAGLSDSAAAKRPV